MQKSPMYYGNLNKDGPKHVIEQLSWITSWGCGMGKKVVRSARRKNKKMGIARRDGKNKKKMEKGESEKEDIKVIE